MVYFSKRCAMAILLAWGAVAPLSAAEAVADPLSQYREMLGGDNPADLWVSRGEALWTEPRGPRKATLVQCDLGLGAGVVKGAYARLPRYFSETGAVEDLESRLVSCMVQFQGFKREEILASRFGDGERHSSDLEALVAYVVTASKGERMAVPQNTSQEKRAYSMGKAIFFYRAGTHDFSCATCHSADNKRIRLQALPNLTTPTGAQAAYTTWPAYRVSQGEFRTMEWRLNDCFRQQRLPDLKYGSPAAIALTEYLARNANGAVLAAPAIKR